MDASLQSIGDLALTNTITPLRQTRVASEDAIDKAAKNFEGMFATQMLQPMFEGLEPDPMFGGGHGEEVMRSFMLQEYGKAMASSGALNLSSAIKNAMIQAQNVAHKGGKDVVTN